MSSYQPLADHLASRKGDIWDASFGEIERALGRPLPRSAYLYNAWWANQSGPGHSQTHGWRSVGWRTAKLDLEGRRVRFERERKTELQAAATSRTVMSAQAIDDDLVRRAMAVSEIESREGVINAALREFIKREAIRAMVDMGGSAPGFEAAPRERPWS